MYEIVDNFLSESDVALFTSMTFDVGPIGRNAYKHRVYQDSTVQSFYDLQYSYSPLPDGGTCLTDEQVLALDAAYYSTCLSHLLEKTEYTEADIQYIDFICNHVGKDFVYDRTPQSATKMLCVHVYLDQTANRGLLYTDTELNIENQEVAWQHNRAVIYAPSETRWHTYSGDGVNPRTSANINLRRSL